MYIPCFIHINCCFNSSTFFDASSQHLTLDSRKTTKNQTKALHPSQFFFFKDLQMICKFSTFETWNFQFYKMDFISTYNCQLLESDKEQQKQAEQEYFRVLEVQVKQEVNQVCSLNNKVLKEQYKQILLKYSNTTSQSKKSRDDSLCIENYRFLDCVVSRQNSIILNISPQKQQNYKDSSLRLNRQNER